MANEAFQTKRPPNCREAGATHCWHAVGNLDQKHGPFTLEEVSSERIFGCCHCAALETTGGRVALATEVRFDCAKTKARMGA